MKRPPQEYIDALTALLDDLVGTIRKDRTPFEEVLEMVLDRNAEGGLIMTPEQNEMVLGVLLTLALRRFAGL
ncbi:hypothetical protein SEA_LITTLELAF_12 [Mycobacterium phage LittleLaf]|uniref:Uncharacterized protein n=5 Tax=Marvinvirus marvin TaxID=1982092 RepID=A0A3G8FEN4_9CAUD|nr:hypothetical protein SEA_LITTLELAF_12 [Mycobacterium phage LittleLaf]AZF93281.1 hypothetical protein SEA_BEELZEBUB_15 [Mycobacterium phage Beelzebub]QFP94152.1 hypothetical protein SEA_JOIEB_13 [Mycobacterium phage JoieB]QFP96876.1 hypothetical protein SEA_PRINGAR_12 [Mycobacterium phage Pringar]QFP97568.1 hypothetical protein SEA_CORAZON_12 [Mycobacterium phage Corazon]URP22504.1 hypothetical protein SEA_HUPHLEPUFF_13 [Mycobacterium phage Huphlepuff]WAA20117.1 hypothetical protein SEA_CLA